METLNQYSHFIAIGVALVSCYAIPIWIASYHIVQVHRKLNSFVSDERYEALQKEFDQYQKESIKWSIDDLIGTASRNGQILTREKAQEALERMIHKHDPMIGITWDTIDIYASDYCQCTE